MHPPHSTTTTASETDLGHGCVHSGFLWDTLPTASRHILSTCEAIFDVGSVPDLGATRRRVCSRRHGNATANAMGNPRAASRHILFMRYSTSGLFPTWALLDVGSVPDASLVRSMRVSKNSFPAAIRSDLCCATSCLHLDHVGHPADAQCAGAQLRVARCDLCCQSTAHVCDSAESVRKYFPYSTFRSGDTWTFVCASAGALHRCATVPTLAKHTSFEHKYLKLFFAHACAGAGLRRFAQATQACAVHVTAKND